MKKRLVSRIEWIKFLSIECVGSIRSAERPRPIAQQPDFLQGMLGSVLRTEK